jgi:drug/metabolite transporter (DMT)-like permease
LLYLVAVSLIWAFSFGLIKGHLTTIDPSLVAALRLALAWLVFLPFTRIKHCPYFTRGLLLCIGAVQYGLMYTCYTASFAYLQAYQVALFTIFTPIFVTAINDLFSLRFHRRFFSMSLLAVTGTAIVLYRDFNSAEFHTGFLLLQGANLCFAFGQVAYCKLMRTRQLGDRNVFSLLYLGGFAATIPMLVHSGGWHDLGIISLEQWLALLYLGILASGLCFFCWTYGARKVNAGVLAVSNNLKIPLAIACSALFFGEHINLTQLLLGSGIILLALLLNPSSKRGD